MAKTRAKKGRDVSAIYQMKLFFLFHRSDIIGRLLTQHEPREIEKSTTSVSANTVSLFFSPVLQQPKTSGMINYNIVRLLKHREVPFDQWLTRGAKFTNLMGR